MMEPIFRRNHALPVNLLANRFDLDAKLKILMAGFRNPPYISPANRLNVGFTIMGFGLAKAPGAYDK